MEKYLGLSVFLIASSIAFAAPPEGSGTGSSGSAKWFTSLFSKKPKKPKMPAKDQVTEFLLSPEIEKGTEFPLSPAKGKVTEFPPPPAKVFIADSDPGVLRFRKEREKVEQERRDREYAEWRVRWDKEKIEEDERRRKEEMRKAELAKTYKMELNQLFVEDVAETENRLFSSFYDQLAHDWVSRKVASKSKVVFLAVGNSFEELSEHKRSGLLHFLKRLKNREVLVVYDADSNAASLIEEEVSKDMRLGITGRRNHTTEQIVSIQNPYLRLMAILSFDKIVISSDSILGVGLMLEGSGSYKREFYPLNQPLVLSRGLYNWARALEQRAEKDRPIRSDYFVHHEPSMMSIFFGYEPEQPKRSEPQKRRFENLGIQYSDNYRMRQYQSFKEIVEAVADFDSSWSLGPTVPSPMPSFDFKDAVDQLSGADTIEYFEMAKAFSRLQNRLDSTPQSAVLFGSGKGCEYFEDLIGDAVRELAKGGYGIATGGAGGFMELANRIATREHAYSLGISLGGRGTLASERRVYSEYHDSSITVQDYSHRIPLLLHQRKLILMAPGGSGTMKELATTLTQVAAESSGHIAPILFLSSEYYGELTAWLKNLDLPENLLKKVIEVNGPEDIKPLLN